MSQAARMTGVNVAIDYSPSGAGGDWTSFGAIQNATVDQSKQEFDATAGLDANIVRLTGKPDNKITGAYVLEHDNVAILDAAEATAPKLLRLYIDKTGHPAKYWQGLYNVSGQVTISCTDAVKGNLTLSAAGSIARTWS